MCLHITETPNICFQWSSSYLPAHLEVLDKLELQKLWMVKDTGSRKLVFPGVSVYSVRLQALMLGLEVKFRYAANVTNQGCSRARLKVGWSAWRTFLRNLLDSAAEDGRTWFGSLFLLKMLGVCFRGVPQEPCRLTGSFSLCRPQGSGGSRISVLHPTTCREPGACEMFGAEAQTCQGRSSEAEVCPGRVLQHRQVLEHGRTGR